MMSNPIPEYTKLHWRPIDVTVEQVAWIGPFIRKVWETISPDDQASILAHWDRCKTFPVIELWQAHPQRHGKPPAQTIGGGYGLSLDLAPLSRFLQESWIELVIAHELAHNYLYSIGAPSHALTEPDDPANLSSHLRAEKEDASSDKAERMEEDAVAVLVRWQFSRSEHEAAIAWGHRTNWGENA
jgi:hypothetical protein